MNLSIRYEEGIVPFSNEVEEKLQSCTAVFLKEFQKEACCISILFCSKETIQSLNCTYRQHNDPTDILSWESMEEELSTFCEETRTWGEIALCVPVCQEQADQFKWDFETELIRLLVHGVVHVAGYDHELSEEAEQEMLAMELKLLDLVGYGFVYRD